MKKFKIWIEYYITKIHDTVRWTYAKFNAILSQFTAKFSHFGYSLRLVWLKHDRK